MDSKIAVPIDLDSPSDLLIFLYNFICWKNVNIGYHTIIVGSIYLLSSLLFIPKSRNNIFDKGYGWMLFAVFHGIDEIADGMVQIDLLPDYSLIFERMELAFFFLSSSFLLLATLIKVNWIRGSEIFKIGFGVQLPVILFFLFSSESVVDTIDAFGFTLFGVEVKYFTVIFGLLPTLPLAIIYFLEFLNVSRRFRGGKSVNRVPLMLLILSLMLVLYNIGEIFASVNIYFLYLEVVTIMVVLLVPLEFNLGADERTQLFLVYHSYGYLVLHVKFNTSLDSETLNLVTGFLTAINTMVREELHLGDLERLETGNGFLYLVHKGDLIYAVLMETEDPTIIQKLHNISGKLDDELATIDLEMGVSLTMDQINKMESLVIQEFA
jgi:hypothetical protein